MNGVNQFTFELLGLSSDIHPLIGFLSGNLFIMFFILFPFMWIYMYLSRKLAADLEARVGPSAPFGGGVLFPLFHLVKVLFKSTEDTVLPGRFLGYFFWFLIVLTLVTGVPMSSYFITTGTQLGVFFPIGCGLVITLGLILSSMFSSEIGRILGSLRLAAQAGVAAIVCILAIISLGITLGTFNWVEIIGHQGFWPWSWNLVSGNNPFHILDLFLVYVGGLALFGITPFGSPFWVGFDVGIAPTSYSIRELVRFGRGMIHFIWAVYCVNLFLGGWQLPGVCYVDSAGFCSGWIKFGLEIFVLTSKTLILMLIYDWFTKTMAEYTVIAATRLLWKNLAVFGLISILISILIRWLG